MRNKNEITFEYSKDRDFFLSLIVFLRLVFLIFGFLILFVLKIVWNQISDDRIRGFLTSTHVLTENFGILLGYIIGAFFEFYAIPLCAIILAISSGMMIYFLHETPLFLVKQNKIAVRSVSFSEKRFVNFTKK